MTPDQKLCDCAAEGDSHGVSSALDEGADPNARFEGYLTPALHLAVRFGNLEMVERLLNAGADPDERYGQENSLDVARLCRADCAASAFDGVDQRVSNLDNIIELLETRLTADAPIDEALLFAKDIDPPEDDVIRIAASTMGWDLGWKAFETNPFTQEEFMELGFGKQRAFQILWDLVCNGVARERGEDQWFFARAFPGAEDANLFSYGSRDVSLDVLGAIEEEFQASEFTLDEIIEYGFRPDDAKSALYSLQDDDAIRHVRDWSFVYVRQYRSDVLRKKVDDGEALTFDEQVEYVYEIEYDGLSLTETGEQKLLNLAAQCDDVQLLAPLTFKADTDQPQVMSWAWIATYLGSAALLRYLASKGAPLDAPNYAGRRPIDLACERLKRAKTTISKTPETDLRHAQEIVDILQSHRPVVPTPAAREAEPIDSNSVTVSSAGSDLIRRDWERLSTAFGAGEFSFDDLLDEGFGNDEANEILTGLKDFGIVETVGLRRFVVSAPFPEETTQGEKALPRTDGANAILDADDAWLPDVVNYGVVDGALNDKGESVLLRLIDDIELARLNRIFAWGPEHRDLHGSSMMHLAVRLQSVPAIERLIGKGADFNMEDSQGVTSRELAETMFGLHEARRLPDSEEALPRFKRMIELMDGAQSRPGTEAQPRAKQTVSVTSKIDKKRRKTLERMVLNETTVKSRPWWKFWR